LRIRNFSESI